MRTKRRLAGQPSSGASAPPASLWWKPGRSIRRERRGEAPKSGVEVVDPVTQLYVIGRFEYGEGSVPFDDLNTLAHGVLGGSRAAGVELMGARSLTAGPAALIAQSGSSLRFRDYLERGEH